MATEAEQLPKPDFRAVYDEHFDFVWRSLRRLGIASSDISDAVQEVFMVVHRKLDQFEGRAQLSTWLYRICLRVASDRRRRAHARREDPSDIDSLEVPDFATNSEEQLVKGEDLRLLEATLGALSLDQRAVFTLFEFECLSGDAIAETLGIPLGTVYSRLRLGRETFRKAMHRELARRRAPMPVHFRIADNPEGREDHD